MKPRTCPCCKTIIGIETGYTFHNLVMKCEGCSRTIISLENEGAAVSAVPSYYPQSFPRIHAFDPLVPNLLYD